MRALAPLLSCLLVALPAFAQDAGPSSASDGGVRKAAARAADGGTRPDAGVAAKPGPADAGTAGGYKPRATFVLARDNPTLDKWSKVKPEQRAALMPLKGVKIGDRAFLGIFVEGYELPQSRRVDLAADLLIVDCTGRTVFEKALVSGAKVMDPRLDIAVPLMPSVELLFGLTDPECDYKVTLTVYDQVRGQSIRTEGTFPVTR